MLICSPVACASITRFQLIKATHSIYKVQFSGTWGTHCIDIEMCITVLCKTGTGRKAFWFEQCGRKQSSLVYSMCIHNASGKGIFLSEWVGLERMQLHDTENPYSPTPPPHERMHTRTHAHAHTHTHYQFFTSKWDNYKHFPSLFFVSYHHHHERQVSQVVCWTSPHHPSQIPIPVAPEWLSLKRPILVNRKFYFLCKRH